MNELAKAIYDKESTLGHINSSNDKVEMHEDAIHHLQSHLSNIKFSSEIRKDGEYTWAQLAIFDLMKSCMAELYKRGANIEEMLNEKI